MSQNLSGKIALITGASRKIGIGSAIALQLARSGADIFLTYYRPYDSQMAWGSRPEEVETLLQEIRALGVRAAGWEADLADPSTPALLLAKAEVELGQVDILVNNATHDTPADLGQLTAEALDRHYAVNLRGMALLCTEFFRRHDGRPGGRIINLTSGQSLGPMPESLPYVATKGAVEALTLSMSVTAAQKGITVNAVDPGATDTGWMPPELYADLAARSPFGRVGLPEDAARLIAFLASEEAQWITGQVIHSRGGL